MVTFDGLRTTLNLYRSQQKQKAGNQKQLGNWEEMSSSKFLPNREPNTIISQVITILQL